MSAITPRPRRRTRRRRFYRPITLRHRVFVSLLTILIVTVIGTIGFAVIQDWPLLTALYHTVVTISTVGAYDRPLSPGGHAFSLVLIMLGMTVVGFAIFSFTQLVVEGTLLEVMGQRRLGRELERLRDHVIICGAGRIGTLVAEDLLHANVEFVVIDSDEDRIQELLSRQILALEGNAGDEEVLLLAGVERANTLISAVHSDADNLYITMTARSMNGKLYIVARAEDQSTVNKLLRVGANKVVAPYHLGALRIANAVLRPAVTDVMELTMRESRSALGLSVGEVELAAESRLAGKTLRETRLRTELGCIVIGLRTPTGETSLNPEPDTPLEAGSLLVAIGTQDQLDRLTEWSQRA